VITGIVLRLEKEKMVVFLLRFIKHKIYIIFGIRYKKSNGKKVSIISEIPCLKQQHVPLTKIQKICTFSCFVIF